MSDIPIGRLLALPFFDARDYLALNPDLDPGRVDPADHAFRHGLTEGRPIFRRQSLAGAWGRASLDVTAHAPAVPQAVEADPDACPRVSVFVSTASDPVEVALAADLTESLALAGVTAVLKDQSESPEADHGLPIVVAPHSFFHAGKGLLWAGTDAIERSLTFNTAPMHRRSFTLALPWILRSRGVMDVSPEAVQIFRSSGLHAFLMRIAAPLRNRWLEASDLSHPLIQSLPQAARRLDFDARAWDERPIDVAFFDVLTTRRGSILRRQAPALAARPCFLYTAQGGRDLLDERVERRSHHRLSGHVSAHAKVTLHLSEDEFPYFDWYRCMARTVASGSIVVSDIRPAHPDPEIADLVFHDDERHLGEMIRWLLDDEDGRRFASTARETAARTIVRPDTDHSESLQRYLRAAVRSTSA
ncbi:hypothetical protein [Lichenibacterium dinghuense]|uniref:hypothetical protein n=1 Tax=Lichenibacterium dinghuense TaxID=2895977 RepID=UPI001F28386E|nr:hypothetical protein [Lichenibacterium sp. 6Y81]